MAVETTDNRRSYSGNGVTTAFSFPYKFLADEDLVVIVRNDDTGVETTKTLTTHYTVTGEGEAAGGTVTMLTAPTADESIVIYSDPDATQPVDLVENDRLPAETTEQALDRLTILVQRLQDRIDRSSRLSDGFSPSFDPTWPANLDQAAGKIPVVNDTGDGWEEDVDDWADPSEVESGALLTAHNADTTGIHGITDTAQLVTLDTAQTVAAIKTFDVSTKHKHVSTPSNPASGYLSMYAKNTGLLYTLSSAGVERVLGGGGGGGSALLWEEQANAPSKILENNMSVYNFEATLGQELYTEVHVPLSYVPGNPIALKIKHYSPNSSGDMLMRAQATLIQAEVDDVASTTNQRTTTNSVITASAANNDEIQKVSLDITSSTGTINSVAVAAGDTIAVRLYRDASGTDTALDDIKLLHKQCEVTFS